MKIREQLSKKEMGHLPKELTDKISLINRVLKKRNEAFKDVEKAAALYNEGKFTEFRKLLQRAAEGPATLLRDIPEIKQAFFELQTKKNDFSNPIKSTYEASEGVLKGLTNQLNIITDKNGIYIQMGCWLIAENEERPIHLEGFDNIPEQDEYIVPRWQFVPSEEEQKKLEELTKFTKENEGKGPKVILEIAKKRFNSLEGLLRTKLNEAIQELIKSIKADLEKIKDKVPKIIQALETLETTAKDYVEFINKIVEKYKNIESTYQGDLTKFIIESKTDLDAIIKQTDDLKTTFETNIKLIENELKNLPTNIKQFITQFITQTIEKGKDVISAIKGELKKMAAHVGDKLKELLNGRAFDMAALEFSEKVFKLNILNTPDKTTLPLKKTGYRENGDKFAVKLVVGSAKTNKIEITESRAFTLFMVLPHIKTIAGLIFTQATGEGEDDPPFQMAPSYNILFKGLWDKKKRRKSILYNRLWDFSFGLNLASLDFNNDNTQELGVGIVLSGIKDYMQVGYGYNIMEKKPYWFFGLRIPIIPAINLSTNK
jgi:hypothetical protein